MDEFISRENSKTLKGMAAILLLAHHLWGFPTLIDESNILIPLVIGKGINITEVIGHFGKISVAIFAFLSGYGMCQNWVKYQSVKYRLKKIVISLTNYWIICAIFLFVGSLTREPLPNVRTLLLNMFGIGCSAGSKEYISVGFAWYIGFYCIMLLIIPLAMYLKRSFWIDQVAVVVIFCSAAIVAAKYVPEIKNAAPIWNVFRYTPIVFAGFNVAYYKIFDKVASKIPTAIKWRWSLLLVLSVIYSMYYKEIGKYIELFIAPLLIYCFCFALSKEGKCKRKFTKVLSKISNESTNMWYLQGLFFTPHSSLQWIAYIPQYSLLVLIWTIFITYWASSLLTFVKSLIGIRRRCFEL